MNNTFTVSFDDDSVPSKAVTITYNEDGCFFISVKKYHNGEESHIELHHSSFGKMKKIVDFLNQPE